MPTNKAAWLTEKCAYPFEIDDAPMPTPEAYQITIRVRAAAINPVDGVIQSMGMVIEEFPTILGFDAAGEVTAVGSAAAGGFKVGDRVTGMHDQQKPNAVMGAMQLYCNLRDTITAKIPDDMSFTDACVFPVCMCTAATALFEEYNLGLPLPQVEPPKPVGKVVLIWGGASSVGSCGIQASKSAGLEVATTASVHNHEYCRSIGADYVFDYKKEGIVDDIVKALKGKEFAGVFSAVFGEDVYIKGAEIASRLGGKQMVATVLPLTMKTDVKLAEGVELGYSKS